jgi:hypothetical protein
VRADRIDLARTGPRIEEGRPCAEQTRAEKGGHLREAVLGDDDDAVSSDDAMYREQGHRLAGGAEEL